MARKTRVGEVVLHRKCAQHRHGEGGDDGHHDLKQRLASPYRAQESDERPEHGRSRHVERRGMQDQADSQRERGVADDAHQRPEPGGHGADLIEPAQPIDRRHRCTFSSMHQMVEGCDLVEPRRGRQQRRQLERRRFPRPIVTIM